MSVDATPLRYAPSILVMQLTWLDFIRRKDLYVVAIFMGLFVVGTVSVRLLGIQSADVARLLMSGGLALSHVLAALLAAAFAARALAEEFEPFVVVDASDEIMLITQGPWEGADVSADGRGTP